MKDLFEIPEVAPTYVERIVQAYNHFETVKKRLDSVQDKRADFNFRRAAAAEKIKVGRDAVEEAQKALQVLILNRRGANESAVKSARSEFNNSLSVLKAFHRELERLNSAERIDLEKEADTVEEQYAEAEKDLWKAVNEAEMIRFADIARRIVHRLYISAAKTYASGAAPVTLGQFVIGLLAGDCGRINPEEVLQEYLNN
jgi:hypothetical protein